MPYDQGKCQASVMKTQQNNAPINVADMLLGDTIRQLFISRTLQVCSPHLNWHSMVCRNSTGNI